MERKKKSQRDVTAPTEVATMTKPVSARQGETVLLSLLGMEDGEVLVGNSSADN